MRDWIEFVAAYPFWVRVTVATLFGIILVLLVAFRPQPNNGENESLVTPDVGTAVVLDLSQSQAEWRGLTAWGEASEIEVTQLDRPFSKESFQEQPGILIFALPKNNQISDAKVRTIKGWVEAGGGLLVLGYYAADTHHGSNPSRLTREWGIEFEDNLIAPGHISSDSIRRHAFRADEQLGIRIDTQQAGLAPITEALNTVVALSAASMIVEHATAPIRMMLSGSSEDREWIPEGPLDGDGMRPIIESWKAAGPGAKPVFVAFESGRGRVAIAGTWKMAVLDSEDNRKFVSNVLRWLVPRTGR